jgi:hypothetical protein
MKGITKKISRATCMRLIAENLELIFSFLVDNFAECTNSFQIPQIEFILFCVDGVAKKILLKPYRLKITLATQNH